LERRTLFNNRQYAIIHQTPEQLGCELMVNAKDFARGSAR
jgi:hypothetical protein